MVGGGGASQQVINILYVPMAGHVLGLNLKPATQFDLARDLQRAFECIQAKRLRAEWTNICRCALAKFQQFLQQQRGLRFWSGHTAIRDRDWARYCRKLGWNYRSRIANNTLVTLAAGRPCALNLLGVKPGRPRYFQNVRLTAQAAGGCNLAVTWTKATPKQPAELCACSLLRRLQKKPGRCITCRPSCTIANAAITRRIDHIESGR